MPSQKESTVLTLDDAQRAQLETLLELDTNVQEKERIRFLLSVPPSGHSPVYIGGVRSADLLSLFSTIGPLAVLDAPGGRGASFAANQGRGAWAESLLRGHAGPERFINFGLSTPISPTDPDYEAVRRWHRYILLREGKRPDLLLVPASALAANPSIATWERRPLMTADQSALAVAVLAGVEIKSSLYNWGQRERYRSTMGGRTSPVSIPLKDEEMDDLTRWQAAYRIPIMIVQVFVDSVHGCSLDYFKEEIVRGRARCYTEPKTTKRTCYLPLPDESRKLADIALAAGQPPFVIADNGEVTNPRTWPRASLSNVNLTKLSSRAAALKARYAKYANP